MKMLCQLKCWMKFFFCPMYSWMFFKSTHVLCNNTVMYLLIMYRCFCYNQTITIGSSIQYCLWFFDIHCMILFLILTWYYWLERLSYTFEFIAYCLITTMYQYTWICTIFLGGGGQFRSSVCRLFVLTDKILNHKVQNEFISYQSNTHINQIVTVHTFS